MSVSDSGREPLEKLAEEFAERVRRGERPSLTEYTGRHPELAEEIRQLFPALVLGLSESATCNRFVRALERLHGILRGAYATP